MSVSAMSSSFDKGEFMDVHAMLVQGLQSAMLQRLGTLPIEVQALVICTAQAVMPEIANQLTEQLHNLAATICAEKDFTTAIGSPSKSQFTGSALAGLNRLCASLDALARHHSIAPTKRQHLIEALSPLQVFLRNNVLSTNYFVGLTGMLASTA
jgi:hypothetical protein